MNNKRSNDALGRLSTNEFKAVDKAPVYVVLEDVRSAQNVGSAFRTMDAFRGAGLYLCGITPTPPHRDINKTALGATESVEWHYAGDVLQLLTSFRESGITLYAVEQAEDSMALQQFEHDISTPVAFVFGNEVDGVSQAAIDLCDGVVEIPQFGTKHSLNIAVCVGIVLWHSLGRKLK